MGKEARIGLVVVGVLAGALLGVLLKRFVLTSPPEVQRGADKLATQPHAIPTNDKPTVVTAQNDSPGRTADGLGANSWPARSEDRDHGVPHGSYLPAEDSDGAAPRYADQPERSPAVDPFHERFAADPPAEDTEEMTPEAPGALDVGPDGAAALEARQPPKRSPRNPLRRLSAEVPLERAPGDDATHQPNERYEQADPLPPAGDDPFPDFEAGGATGDDVDENTQLDASAATTPGAAEPFAGPGSSSDSPALHPANPNMAAQPPASASSDDIPHANELDQQYSDTTAPSDPAFDAAMPGANAVPDYEPRPVQSSQQQPLNVADAVGQVPVAPVRPADGRYKVQPNDSLWTISQKVYGDGRYYKAIAEHNRMTLKNPDRLSAGTVVEVPPAGLLAQSYPALCPKQRRSAVVPSRTIQAAATAPSTGSDVYVVIEGDTLFDIARYELGQASRWGEIYELNREVLGEDFDFLQPGLQLRMPPRGRPSTPTAISRQPTDRYVR